MFLSDSEGGGLGDGWLSLGLVAMATTFLVALAISRLFLLLLGGGAHRDVVLSVAFLLLLWGSSSGECSHEHVGVCFLQFGEHLLSVLGLRKTARKQLNGVENLHLQALVCDQGDRPLQNIVAILVVDKPGDDLSDAELATPGLVSQLPDQGLVVPVVGSLEDLVDLLGGLGCLQALFDNVRREFELAQSDEISRNEIQNLVVPKLILKLQHVLNQVVSIGVLNEEVDAADDDIGQSKLLSSEAFLKAALHDTASVLVGANLVTVGHAGAENELRVGGIGLGSCLVGLFWRVRSFEGEQEGLDHMIAIWVRRKIEDVLGHLGSQGQNFVVEILWVLAHHLNQGLDSAGSMKVHGDLDDGGEDSVDQLFEAHDGADLDKLLAKVVSELVSHDFWEDVEEYVDNRG